jgi:hypothetical protein
MKETNGARATNGEHPATAEVAPRFTRAVHAERTRLEGRRAQLRRKREAAQAEVARIDRAVEATDELLELLAPLVAVDGSEVDVSGDGNVSAGPTAVGSASEPGEARARDSAHRRASPMRAQSVKRTQPAKE